MTTYIFDILIHCIMTSFAHFTPYTTPKGFKDKFLSQANGLKLNEIIKDSKGKIKVSFFHSNDVEGIFLIMISGYQDWKLIELAKKYGFPRGFPILWIPDVSMQYFGFYPKFSNDDRQRSDDLSEFEDVVSIDFFKKWSGFLGQLFFFQFNGKIFWTTTSKNSADFDSKFVKEAKKLFEPFITNNLAEKMIQDKVHLSAEMMSKNDQVHGARVFIESPVVTSVGHGSFFDLTKKSYDIVQEKFVKFYNHHDLVDFCVKYNLPCDSAIIINNPITAKKFITDLSNNRDYIDNDILNNIISKYCNDITIHKGTVNHEEILGNCLEGLVFKLKHSNGTVSTKKYKFPNYTIRTMLLREQFKNFAFTFALRSRIRDFINGWCVTQDGKDYWYQFALYAFMKYLDFKPKDPDVGSHIQLVESLSGFYTKSNMDEIFNKKMESLLAGTVVLCIGPIGSGKTTIMKKLCKSNDKLVPVDGDKLDLGSDIVAKLGKERNDYTRWKIIETLMKGYVPVVSTGGGVLFSMDRKKIFMLRNHIFETLGVNIRLVVMVADRCDNITRVSNEHDASAIYKDGSIVFETIVTRIGRNEWNVPDKFYGKKKNSTNMDAIYKFADFIKSKSGKNLDFAEKIIMEGDCVFTFPVVTPDNYGSYKTLDFSHIVDNIIYPQNQLSGTFSQIRLLAYVDGFFGHITVEYDTNGEIAFSLGIAKNIEKFYEDDSTCHFYTLSTKGQSKGKDVSFVVPNKSIHDDGTTHITVNPGNHFPKDMKTATKMIKNNEPIILKTKNGDDIEYEVKDRKKCIIQFYGSFAI